MRWLNNRHKILTWWILLCETASMPAPATRLELAIDNMISSGVSCHADSCYPYLEHDEVVQLDPRLKKFARHVDHLETAKF